MAKKEIITENDRSPLVRDMDFGSVSGIEENKNDKPRFATIEYNKDTNQIVYEDYTKLDNFLEKEFIPKKIKIKKYKVAEDNNDIDIIAWIAYHEIQKLRLSEDEIKHVFKFLEERDIYVRGINSTLESTLDFDNYNYISTYKSFKLPETVDWPTQLNWFKQLEHLKATSQDQKAILDLRNKIVEANMRLVPFVAYKFSVKYGFDINELNSCGVFGLINAVDKFDYTKGFMFSTYAYKAILRRMLREYAYELGYKNFNQYVDVRDAVEVIKEFYEENDIDREVAIEEVVTLLRQTRYGEESAINMANEYLGTYDINDEKFSNEEDDEIVSSDEVDFDVPTNIPKTEKLISNETTDEQLIVSSARKAIEARLSLLTEREKIVIKERYGFDDGIVKTLEEVAIKLGVTRERIRQIEVKALRILRRPCSIYVDEKGIGSNRIDLKDYLSLFDEINGSSPKI